MRLIVPFYEIIPQNMGIEGMYKQIELGARCCYHSQNLITEDSYKRLIESLKSRKHYSPFAHGTVYLKVDDESYDGIILNNKYHNNFGSRVNKIENTVYITSNMRVLLENGWEDDLKYWCEPTEYHSKRITVKLNCSIGVSRELNRHSVSLAVCEQSTRYCNYSKDKFGNELTFVIPEGVSTRTDEVAETIDSLTGFRRDYLVNMPLVDAVQDHMVCEDRAVSNWFDSLKKAESDYLYLLSDECDLKPEQARGVLPLDLATEVYYTGYIDDGKHVFEMRCNPAAHPDVRFLFNPLYGEFKLRNYVND